MTPIIFEGHNMLLGTPKDWDEKTNGPCLTMPVLFANNMYMSVWAPSDAERQLILGGRNIALFCINNQPPVLLQTVEIVGDLVPVKRDLKVGKSVFEVLRNLRDAYLFSFAGQELPQEVRDADAILIHHKEPVK